MKLNEVLKIILKSQTVLLSSKTKYNGYFYMQDKAQDLFDYCMNREVIYIDA